jgi:acetoacetate decarboxylase
VVTAIMGYKHCDLSGSEMSMLAALTKTRVNLKLIPGVDGNPIIAQLAAYNLGDVVLKRAWSGPARLHLILHANAPVADLSVKKVLGGRHIVADLTLPYGRVLHDYLD